MRNSGFKFCEHIEIIGDSASCFKICTFLIELGGEQAVSASIQNRLPAQPSPFSSSYGDGSLGSSIEPRLRRGREERKRDTLITAINAEVASLSQSKGKNQGTDKQNQQDLCGSKTDITAYRSHAITHHLPVSSA